MDMVENLDTSENITPTHSFNNDWINPPRLEDLKADLEECEEDHQLHVTDVRRWLDNLNIEGSAKIPKVTGKSSYVPKLIRKQAEWRYSALSEPFLSTEDIFNTSPVTYEDKKASDQNGLVLNHQFNTKIKKVKFIDELVRTVVDEGTAIVKVGWEYEDKIVDKEEPVYEFVPTNNPAIVEQFKQISSIMDNPYEMEKVDKGLLQAMQISQQTGTMVEPVLVGSQIVQETVIVKNQPTLEVCEYDNVRVDPTCKGDLEKANFIIYSFESNLSTLTKDGRYTNLDKIKLSDSPFSDENYDSGEEGLSSFQFKDKARKHFVVNEYWGYWDVNDTGIVEPFVASWVGNTLIRMEPTPFPFAELPFVNIQYLPVRNKTYGEPDGELLEDNQKIVGAVTRGMLDLMGRSANSQIIYRKDAFDLTNRRKFEKGQDCESNPQIEPERVATMLKYPEIPNSAGLMIQLQNNEAESLSGVKAFTQGITSQSLGDSVGGIRSTMDATSKREVNILRRISEGLICIARKVVAMNSEFLSDTEIVRITNDEFIEVRRDDLKGEIDIRIDISTPEADNEKAQELSFMLQTMGNNMDPSMSKMILSEIAKLRKMPLLAKTIEEYEPQPDPLMEEKKKLENELLKAQIQNELSKAHENAANGDLDKARIQETIAKANKLNSEADAVDLDFIKKEDGTKHREDVDKIQSQAEAQAKMKVVEQAAQQRYNPKPTNA